MEIIMIADDNIQSNLASSLMWCGVNCKVTGKRTLKLFLRPK